MERSEKGNIKTVFANLNLYRTNLSELRMPCGQAIEMLLGEGIRQLPQENNRIVMTGAAV